MRNVVKEGMDLLRNVAERRNWVFDLFTIRQSFFGRVDIICIFYRDM